MYVDKSNCIDLPYYIYMYVDKSMHGDGELIIIIIYTVVAQKFSPGEILDVNVSFFVYVV